MSDPELLKRVAEKMGYVTEWNRVWAAWFVQTRKNAALSVQFDPEANPAQLVEMIEWLLHRGWDLCYIKEKEAYQMEKEDLKRGKVLWSMKSTLAKACLLAIDGEK